MTPISFILAFIFIPHSIPTALADVVISLFNYMYEACYLRYFRALHGGAFWNGGEV